MAHYYLQLSETEIQELRNQPDTIPWHAHIITARTLNKPHCKYQYHISKEIAEWIEAKIRAEFKDVNKNKVSFSHPFCKFLKDVNQPAKNKYRIYFDER